MQFSSKPDNNPIKKQIRLKPCIYYMLFIIAAVSFLFTLLIPKFGILDAYLVLPVILYGFVQFRNSRIEYDENGITFYSFFGQSYHRCWEQIVKVSLDTELMMGKSYYMEYALKIHCMDQSQKGEMASIYRYPYNLYIGLEEFLYFYSQMNRDAEQD